jgi:RHS repeat-associated protein
LPVRWHISYRQRGAIVEDPQIFGLGTNWSCSFRAFLVDVSGNGSLLRLHRGSAGWIDYTYGVTQYRDGSILTSTTGGYQITYADGSTDTFTHFYSYTSGSATYNAYFITARADPAGNAMTFTYDSGAGVKLLSVADPDSNSTQLYYQNASFPYQITAVVSPDSRTNLLVYDDQGYLTNTTDCLGIPCQFQYDTGTRRAWITNMVTPYGATGFAYGGVDVNTNSFESGGNVVNRYVTVTLPNGGKELYLFRQDCSGFMSSTNATVPDTSPLVSTLDNVDQNARNSFHWSPLQYANLSTNDPNSLSSADYAIGQLRHWLIDPATTLASSTLSLERAPSPDGSTAGALTWYDYDGKDTNALNYLGTNALPSFIALVLPGGSSRYTHFSRNTHSAVTQSIATYSKTDGTVGQRTNTFLYYPNDIDLLQQVGPQGEEVVSNYFSGVNTIHQPDATSDALNPATTFLYNSYGQVTYIHRPTGLTTTNLYGGAGNALNRLTNTVDFEIRRTNSYTYYGNGQISTHIDERGLTTTNFWDNLLRLTGVAYPNGTASNIYTLLDLTATKDKLGHWSYFGYNAIRQKIAETNANGTVTRYGYCDCGALIYLTNAWNTPAQMVTQFAYDYQGNRTYTYLPDATITNWFDSLARVSQIGDGRGLRTFAYNNQGLRTNTSNAYGTEQATVFDIEDQPLYVTDANSVMLTNTYDVLHRLVSRGYPDGGVEHFGYSARGLIAYTNQIGQSNFFAFDEAGRKTFETNANGEVLRFTNSAAGDLLSLTDGKLQTVQWLYDAYGRVTNKIDQAGTVVLAYTYDAENRLLSRTSAEKGTTFYTNDAVGNLTFIQYPVSPSVSFQYDPLNRLTNMVDAVGTTVYSYTGGGQLFTEDGPFASDTVTNSYSQRMRTSLGLQQPAGAWTNGFIYDAAGRLTNVTSQAGSFAYLFYSGIQNLPAGIRLPNTSYITNYYDSVARLTQTLLNNSANTTLDAAKYGYNQASQRTAFTNAVGTNVLYYYDNIGQLKVADSSDNTEDRGYAYDAAWNLNYLTNNGLATEFDVDNKNELLAVVARETLTYDANGNLSTGTGTQVGVGTNWVYVWDDENRLVQWFYYQNGIANKTTGDLRIDFSYDGLGRLRKRLEYLYNAGLSSLQPVGWNLQSTTEYIYDGKRVIQERDGTNNPTVSYTRGPDLSGIWRASSADSESLEGAGGIGGLLARSHGYSAGNWTTHNFYHADGNGNITYLVDSNQGLAASYRYDPFGNTISSSGPLAAANVYRFSSKECLTNSGMYYFLYRFYDPNVQRWLSEDPIAEPGFETCRHHASRSPRVLPSSAWADGQNLYALVKNRPVDLVDPVGLSALTDEQAGADLPHFPHSPPAPPRPAPPPSPPRPPSSCPPSAGPWGPPVGPFPSGVPCFLPNGSLGHVQPLYTQPPYNGSLQACVNAMWDHIRDTSLGGAGAASGVLMGGTSGGLFSVGAAVFGALAVPIAICQGGPCVPN